MADMEPHQWLSDATRRNFGKHREVEVVEAHGRREAAEILAAHAQHLVALEVTALLKDRSSSIAALAEHLGEKPDTLHRKFRGEQRASLAEMIEWLSAMHALRRFERIWDAVARGHLPKVVTGSQECWNYLEEATTLRARPVPPVRRRTH